MTPQFTDRQLDIMNALWDRGSATVRETKEVLDEDLAYTSVLTVYQTLEKNGHVRHEAEGKAYRFHPTVSRREAGDEAIGYLLGRVFGDSPTALRESVERVVAERAVYAGSSSEQRKGADTGVV